MWQNRLISAWDEKGQRKVRSRSACSDCGENIGLVSLSGPHWKVTCSNCGRYLYFASKWEIEGKMPRLSSREGLGVLFTRDVTAGSPDYVGNCCINNVQYRLVGWIKKSKNGVDYLSLKVDKDD